jgi:cell division protein FtsB
MSRQQPGVHPALILIIIISSILIIGLIRNAYGLYQSRTRLETTLTKEAEIEAKNRTLQAQLKVQSDPAALDQLIRNKLNLVKPGDVPHIIDPLALSEISINSNPTPTPTPSAPIYQWLQVLNPEK